MDRGQSVETEAFQRPAKFDMKAFMRLIRQTKPAYWQLGLGLGLGVIATGIQLAVPHFAGDLINGFGKSIDKTLLVSVIGMFILSAVISALSGTVLGIFGENVVSRLRNTLWDKLIRLRVAYFDETKAGEMTSRLINDSTQIKDLLANSFPRMITSLLTVVGALTLMVLKDWRMTAIMALAIPLVMLVMLPVMRQSHKVGRDRQNSLADFNGAAGETLSEIRLVKSSNAEPFETEKGHTTIQSLYKIGLREAVYDSVAGPLMTAVMMGLFVGVLAYGAHRVSQGTMTMGTMFSFLMYLFQLLGPSATLGQFFSDLAKASGSTERVQALLAEPEEDLTSGVDVDVEGQTLAMSHVDFAYDDSKKILSDVSFEAQPNTVVAFAGPSGGGKSTIFSLLERYYTPTAGEIMIGNHDVSDVNLANWREQIGFVSQDSAIMAGTIRHNLTYGLTGEYSDDDLWRVLGIAFAEKFVRDMPAGLDTEVGERGVKVSGGQRQRLAIARAFLRDPKILMLDEATASLDSESEAMVQKALESLMKGRTTLVIAHRLSTIVDADKIYFIEQGTVSGAGTHKELVANHELYREYVDTQFNQD
ncbi:ABC transporter ATP-binding protein [Weissella confusa]|uniref:Multidrug resistance ABC transporter ATP-binding and permease protein n=1 Tax=Weissella confusa TaxID=1583 RepID=A0A923NFP4_WEICO|nr:ABC transporter ATP-binding protein [Weissella confusa]MBA5933773.1 ABC transporter ATP-binding protein [Weissella confusa]MBC6498176.1 ABC transporter ATP-binding protein [Weissella confusa]MBJ7636700.1 ABC transporter ATP-binding protein [Weissella confusa]MBS6378527.1 ABC transporter ATP-binding protein [Weissella confusa]MCT8397408.1 ABC transporter ATP-binding protein [Weissella confusa]